MENPMPINWLWAVLPSLYFSLNLWYKKVTCCICDVASSVLGQHLFYGFHIRINDAIGFGQGGVGGAKPALREQVQSFAAHGTAGIFLPPFSFAAFPIYDKIIEIYPLLVGP
jgi:hypothetical protein